MHITSDLLRTQAFTLIVFFFNDTATTEIYTLSLHDALPISSRRRHPQYSIRATERGQLRRMQQEAARSRRATVGRRRYNDAEQDGIVAAPSRDEAVVLVPHERADRKSTRLNSSHSQISYAVF